MMYPMHFLQTVIFIVAILEALARAVGVQLPAEAHPSLPHHHALAMSVQREGILPPPPSSAARKLPAELVATWFTGVVPPTDYYNVVTGEWRATNGLGQMYKLSANGHFVYAGFLRIQTGLCLSEVSSYREGKAQASAGKLTLTPSIAKTRTVINCGTKSETTTDGPFEPATFAYRVADEANGQIKLTLDNDGYSSVFQRQGMVPSLVGTWQRGAVTSVDFYDAESKSFAAQSGEGGWYHFNAGGTYRMGEFGYGTSKDGCALTGWIYQEGSVEIAGSKLTLTPTSGMARAENACTPEEEEVFAYVDKERSFTWLYRDRASDIRLVMIPLDAYQEWIFRPE